MLACKSGETECVMGSKSRNHALRQRPLPSSVHFEQVALDIMYVQALTSADKAVLVSQTRPDVRRSVQTTGGVTDG